MTEIEIVEISNDLIQITTDLLEACYQDKMPRYNEVSCPTQITKRSFEIIYQLVYSKYFSLKFSFFNLFQWFAILFMKKNYYQLSIPWIILNCWTKIPLNRRLLSDLKFSSLFLSSLNMCLNSGILFVVLFCIFSNFWM